jgi:hypothetical protein
MPNLRNAKHRNKEGSITSVKELQKVMVKGIKNSKQEVNTLQKGKTKKYMEKRIKIIKYKTRN